MIKKVILYIPLSYSVLTKNNTSMFNKMNLLKTLHDHLNEIGDTITNKQFVWDLLSSLPLDKYEAVITSIDVQSENNLQLDRLTYLPLLSSDSEAFHDSTSKNSKKNFSKSNVSDYNHWVWGKQVNE